MARILNSEREMYIISTVRRDAISPRISMSNFKIDLLK
jgi:hypothetical protein